MTQASRHLGGVGAASTSGALKADPTDNRELKTRNWNSRQPIPANRFLPTVLISFSSLNSSIRQNPFQLLASLRFRKAQPPKRTGHVKIRLRRVGGQPCHIGSRFLSPFDPIKIRSPNRLRVKVLSESFHGNGQLGGPAVRLLVEHDRFLQSAFE